MISDLMSARSRCHSGLEYLVPVLYSGLKGSESPFGEKSHVSANDLPSVVKPRSKRDQKKQKKMKETAGGAVSLTLRLCVYSSVLCA